MCKAEGHEVKECPETKAFVAAGVLHFNKMNCLVMADGSRLPRVGGKGMANAVWELAVKRTSAAYLEWMQEFELENNKFAHLEEPMFEVEPVKRMDKDKGKLSKVKPYDRPPKPSIPVVKLMSSAPEKPN